MSLPMIEFSTDLFNENQLENCYVIGVQHLLPTTYLMFKALCRKGLKPQNISLIGKCYSTDLETYHAMREYGMDICENSRSFDSRSSYDDQFEANIDLFLAKRKEKLKSPEFKKIIILDDGGHFIYKIEKFLSNVDNVVAIEQTSSGYNRLKDFEHTFPIINLARSHAKLSYEPDKIVETALEQIFNIFSHFSILPQRILILGNGAIGQKIYHNMKFSYPQTKVCDIDSDKSQIPYANLNNVLGHFDVIIGCTGSTCISSEQHRFLKKGAMLINVSSSDREFDSVHLRNRINPPRKLECFEHVNSEGIILINNGFPINFYHPNNDDPNFFQYVRALIIGSILQACNHSDSEQKGFIELDKKLQSLLMLKFADFNLNVAAELTSPSF